MRESSTNHSFLDFEKEWVEQHADQLYFWKRVNGTRVKLESGYYILNVGHENIMMKKWD